MVNTIWYRLLIKLKITPSPTSHSKEHSEEKKKKEVKDKGRTDITNASTIQGDTNVPPAPRSAQRWTVSWMILGHIGPSARAMHFPTLLYFAKLSYS